MVITDDARSSAEQLSELIRGASVEDLLDAPFVWIGTVDEIATKLRNAEMALGVSRYVVRPEAMADSGMSSTQSPTVEPSWCAARPVPNVTDPAFGDGRGARRPAVLDTSPLGCVRIWVEWVAASA